MKNLTLLMLFGLVLLSTQSKITEEDDDYEQSKLISNRNPISKLKNTNIGRAIFTLMQLHEGTNYSMENLLQALQLLQESFLNDRDAENDAYDAELQDHEWAIRRIESFLTSYQTQFAGVETDISAISTQIEGFKTDKNVALAQQEIARSQASALEADLIQLQEDFQVQNQDYQITLNIIQDAIDALSSEIGTAFVQTDRSFLDTIAQKLTENSKKVHSVVVFYEPIVQVLAEIKANTEYDADQIQGAINALDSLKGFLAQTQALIAMDYEVKKEKVNNLYKTSKNQLNLLTYTVIPGIEQALSLANDQLVAKQKQQGQINENISQTTEVQNSENKQWDMRTEQHNDLNAQYEWGLSVAVSAGAIIQQGTA